MNMRAPILGNDGRTRRNAIIAVGIMFLAFGAVLYTMPSQQEKAAAAKAAAEARFQARQQALTIAKMETTWRILSEETVAMTEDEGSQGDFKTTLCLAPDNGEPCVFWEFRSNRLHHMPYKVLWQELMAESWVRLEFREDQFAGSETYDYLIPRLEPGTSHSTL